MVLFCRATKKLEKELATLNKNKYDKEYEEALASCRTKYPITLYSSFVALLLLFLFSFPHGYYYRRKRLSSQLAQYYPWLICKVCPHVPHRRRYSRVGGGTRVGVFQPSPAQVERLIGRGKGKGCTHINMYNKYHTLVVWSCSQCCTGYTPTTYVGGYPWRNGVERPFGAQITG